MKRYAAGLLIVFLLMTGLMGLVQMPDGAQAMGSGGMADIGPGTDSNMTMWIPANGTILTWSYSTTSNVEFWIFGPSGMLDHYFPGTEGSSYGNGAWVTTSGNYSFVWRNHELSSRATIDSVLKYCTPINSTLTSPQPGIVNNELKLTASGMMDSDASQVSYSLNNVSYYPITKDPVHGTWNADLNLSYVTIYYTCQQSMERAIFPTPTIRYSPS
jgi:hypothetical protein